MNIRASGRSALIIAAGLWVCFAGPLRATDSAAATSEKAAQNETAGTPVKLSKFSKHRSHHARKHVAHRHKSAKVASRAHGGKARDVKTTASAVPPDGDGQTPLPPAVANASAQMPGADNAPKTEADALASNAGKTLAANANQGDAADAAEPQGPAATADVVPSDQLNDVDRALTETRTAEPALAKPAEPALAMASVETPAAAAPAAETTEQASASEDSAWSQTSLIGKIFIAFGGLLTLASAARMFIA